MTKLRYERVYKQWKQIGETTVETPNVTTNQKSAHGVALALVGVAATAAAVEMQNSMTVAIAAITASAIVEIAVVVADALIRRGRAQILANEALVSEVVSIPDSPDEDM